MRIQVLDSETHAPIIFKRIKLQIKARDSGFLSPITDESGFFELSDAYQGEQIAVVINEIPGSWLTIYDGMYLLVETHQEAILP